MTPARAFAATLAVLVALATGPAGAAELVMFESPGCAWCVKWHRELGTVYPKSDEGRLLPLRVVDVRARPKDLRKVPDVKYTPTFVALDCGREIGRIVGYNGDDLFWGEVSAIVEKLKKEGRPKPSC